MPPRLRSHELAKVFDRAANPVYALDDERRIVLFNAAASQWTGYDREDLLGLECQYHSSPDLSGPAALACSLCPPPEVLTGVEVQARVACSTRDGESSNRLVRFVPLVAGVKEVAGVLAFVSDEIEAEPIPLADPAAGAAPADALHLCIQQWRQTFRERYHLDRLLGQTPALLRVRAQVELAVRTTVSVIVVGPPGSGREHLARAIHYGSPQHASAPLVPLACALVGPELLRSTIAALARLKPGEPRQGGTLLLNDVDRLTSELQIELPRLLTGGAGRFRVISTARRPLTAPPAAADEVAFHPLAASILSTLSIELPGLADRLDDLPLLAQLSLEQANARGPKQVGRFTEEALDALAAYPWQRNLDELDELVRQAHANAQGPQIAADDLPQRIRLAAAAAAHPRPAVETLVLDEYLATIERELIERAMSQAKGNKTKAAELLGLNRARLTRRLVQLGLAAAAEFEAEEVELEGERESGSE